MNNPLISDEELLADRKKSALIHIKNKHAVALKIESGDYTTEERDTWPTQLQAAKDFIANKADAADIRMLDRLCREGESKADLSKKIIAKHTAGKELIGISGEVKRSAEDAVKAATTVADIDAAMMTASKEMQMAIVDFKKQMVVASSNPVPETN